MKDGGSPRPNLSFLVRTVRLRLSLNKVAALSRRERLPESTEASEKEAIGCR